MTVLPFNRYAGGYVPSDVDLPPTAPRARLDLRRLADLDVSQGPPSRLSTHRVIDIATSGGLVKGCAAMLSGAPGAGKSTLLLEVAAKVPRALYASGEETAEALARRAERLGVRGSSTCMIAATKDADAVADAILDHAVPLVIVDSVQTFTTSRAKGALGSPSQVREVADLLYQAARRAGATLILVLHETKSGGYAGPRWVEHLVDVVLRMEREPQHRLICEKNRDGKTPVAVSITVGPRGVRMVPGGISVVD